MEKPPAPSPPPPVSNPLKGRDRFVIRYRWRGAWVRWDVFAPSLSPGDGDREGKTPLLSVVRPGHFWLNLLAGIAGLVSGFAFMALFLVLAFRSPGDSAQVVLGLTGILGGVAVLFLVDIALSPRRYFRSAIPDKERGGRPGFRLREDRKVTFFSSSFTLRSSEGEVLARISKNYLRNLGRRKWTCRGPEGELLCQAVEDSRLRSLLYRVLGGGLGFLTTDYLFLRPGEGEVKELGRFRRRRPHHRHHLLVLTGDLDPEVAVALAVVTDAVEMR